MPLLTIRTNQPLTQEQQQNLLCKASSATAAMLGKPESYVMVQVLAGEAMMFGGNMDPCALLELKSLGLPETQSADFSSQLCNLIQQQLDIPSNRIYIEFSNPARHLWGWDGRTF